MIAPPASFHWSSTWPRRWLVMSEKTAPACSVGIEMHISTIGSRITGPALLKPSTKAREPAILKLASSESTWWNLPS